uniref:Homing endonuclease LAGLIDADG domain-containing protein n=1 Tax=Dactylella sp. TaxID=1814903 RepID=A0A482DS24_9PEZI|nr:hypothetical protein [Dactylella sp.]
MAKFCLKYNIELKQPLPLTFNNGWFSGFIDSDGSVYYSETSGQVFISIFQKSIYLLELLVNVYGGKISPVSKKIDAFKYVVYKKDDLFNLIDNSFIQNPLRTLKLERVKLIKQFYTARFHRNSSSSTNEWLAFKNKWENYNSSILNEEVNPNSKN